MDIFYEKERDLVFFKFIHLFFFNLKNLIKRNHKKKTERLKKEEKKKKKYGAWWKDTYRKYT